MQFTVPQFIDVEDKIIGPITVRQFIMLVIAMGFLFAEYKLSDMSLFIVLAVPTVAFFGTFAFAKVNGMPFHYFVINIIETFKKPKVRIWLRESFDVNQKTKSQTSEKTALTAVPVKQPITRSRLSDLSLIVDTGGVYGGAEEQKDLSFKS